MQRVMVGLSGGVDSSVAALRLQKMGYEVIGVFIKVWHPDFLVCNWQEERRDAMRVAAHLGIPFLTCNAESVYYEAVAKYFIEAYQAGETPNPDVMCNRAIKFGAFRDFAKKHGVDLIATGHYAQNIYNHSTQQHELHRGVDVAKDQTYFLWTLTQTDLTHVCFPIGDTTKEEIRNEAIEHRIPTAQKPDSQGICFLGHVDIYEFLSHFIDLTSGPVCDTSGKKIGEHLGSVCYTVGQRHGYKVTDSSYAGIATYVQSLDHLRNMLIVDTKPPVQATKAKLSLRSINLMQAVSPGTQCQVQLRYRQRPVPAIVENVTETNMGISLESESDDVATGQSCVLYSSKQCLGGGIIQR